ncbi:hypothetical protein ACQ4PT_025726 [Festuca glaucescens]
METVQCIILAGASIVEATQLDNDLSRLRTSLPRARVLIDRAEWGRFKNKELAVLLSLLKDTTHDAEDLLRKLDDQVLQQNMKEANQSRVGQFVSSSLKLAKSLLSGSKARVKEGQSRLDKVVAEIEGILSFTGLTVEPLQLDKPLMPETSSVISEPVVFGRDKEQDHVIKLLGVLPIKCRSAKRMKSENSRAIQVVSGKKACMEDVSILPIVGIGGVGKTTLCQLVYNDSRVKAHFEMRMWVCVYGLFDIRRITKEIIECTSAEISDLSLNALQVELRRQLEEQRFLLILDDVWPNANQEWQRFSAPLRYGRQGSMILVTTRSLKVADLVGTIEPVKLKGLPTDIVWEFFKKCAFSKEQPESYPKLQDIGQSIASRLCGSPLAAKTLGGLLDMELRQLTEQHWITIQNSELWELPHEENEILPALQLSYLYLPQELKRCFAICSIFQKDYSFERDELVDIWVAQGFVASGGSMRLEDMVDECFLMQDFVYWNRRRMPLQFVIRQSRWTVKFLSTQRTGILLVSINCIHLGLEPDSSLQVFDANRSSLKTVHQDLTKLVNLRSLALPPKCLQKLSTLMGIGNMSSLRNLTYFTVGRVNGRRITEPKHMNQLTGTLTIRYVGNIRSKEEATEARLVDKQYLRGLILQWRSDRFKLRSADNEVLEGLYPSRIEHLKLGGFGGDVLSSWFKPGNLPTLRILELCDAYFLRYLSVTFHSLEHTLSGDDSTHCASSRSSNGITRARLTSLTTLVICSCHNLINLDQFLCLEFLPSVKSIDIYGCENIVSIPVHTFVGFTCLHDLKIRGCWKLVCPREMVLPNSIQRIEVWNCGELDRSFPGCLHYLPSLTLLHLRSCHHVELIPLNSMNTNKLTCLVLRFCSKLSAIGGSHALLHIKHVEISNCPELTEVHQPLLNKGLRTKAEKEVLKFIQEYWSYTMFSLDAIQK